MNERRIIIMWAVNKPYYNRIGRLDYEQDYYTTEEEAKAVSERMGYTYHAQRVYADTFGL